MEIKLPSRSWVLEVKATLETLIQRYGKMGEAYDPADRPIAVFDWDDTVIFNDVGMGVFYFQIDELQFNFELEEFWNLIPPNYNREVCRANYEKFGTCQLMKLRSSRLINVIENSLPKPFMISGNRKAPLILPYYKHNFWLDFHLKRLF